MTVSSVSEGLGKDSVGATQLVVPASPIPGPGLSSASSPYCALKTKLGEPLMNTRTSIAQPEREPFILESRKAAAPIVHLWLLRMLVPLGAHKEFIESIARDLDGEEFVIQARNSVGENEDLIIRTLGLEHWIEQKENDEFDKKSALKELSNLHEAAEKELKNAKVPDPLANNIEQIATLAELSETDYDSFEFLLFLLPYSDYRLFELLTLLPTERLLAYLAKLSETDCRILEFLTLLCTEQSLAYVVENYAPLNDLRDHQDVVSVLSALLALPQDEICLSLAKNSVLTKLGLVKLELSGHGEDLKDILELSDEFADRFVSDDPEFVDLLHMLSEW